MLRTLAGRVSCDIYCFKAAIHHNIKDKAVGQSTPPQDKGIKHTIAAPVLPDRAAAAAASACGLFAGDDAEVLNSDRGGGLLLRPPCAGFCCAEAPLNPDLPLRPLPRRLLLVLWCSSCALPVPLLLLCPWLLDARVPWGEGNLVDVRMG